ncbi:MAG: MFS transporter [Sphingomonadaceae bacterium]|nr:MFS transporter [Sphingomonadaceae bacterium]MCP5390849.1 MFS transporter [Sphingomonadaceae bacterium]
MICLIVSPAVLAPISFGVFSPYLRDEFGWSMGEIGQGIAAMSLSVMISSLLSGIIVDRLGVRRVVLTCIPLFSIGYALMGFQTGAVWQFMLLWLLVPFVGLGLWPGSWGKATAGWFNSRLGLAMAIATLGIGIGATIMPFVINGLASNLGWRMAYVWTAVGALVIALPMSFAWLHEAPKAEIGATAGATATTERIFPRILLDPRLLCLCLGFITLGWFSATLLANFILILESGGMARSDAVIAQSLIGVSTVIGRVFCGWLLDRFPFKLVVPAFCLATAGAVFALSGGVTGSTNYIIAIFVGMLVGAEIDVLGFAIQKQFGRPRFATLFGMIFALFHLGGAMGGMISGKLHDATGGFQQPLVIAAAACVASAVIFAIMPWRKDPVA